MKVYPTNPNNCLHTEKIQLIIYANTDKLILGYDTPDWKC